MAAASLDRSHSVLSQYTATYEYTPTYPENSCPETKNVNIQFLRDANLNLRVVMETERLFMCTVTSSKEDIDNFASLYGDPVVMHKFATGETKSRDDIMKRIQNLWCKRLSQNDPYVAFSVFTKKGECTGVSSLRHTDNSEESIARKKEEFIGTVILGHSVSAGESELAYLILPQFWNKKYGTEAIHAAVFGYSLATIEEEYLMDRIPLIQIIATSRPDNENSDRILKNMGMSVYKEEEKFNALRHHYIILIEAIRKKVNLEKVV